MSVAQPSPPAEWIPLFTRSFTHEQILNPEYMFSKYRAANYVYRDWCKLCDAPVSLGETPDEHRRQHKKELKDYARKSKAEAERRRNAALEARRREKELEREVIGGEGGGGGLPEEKRLKNRVTSARYKINHPEKHGREAWSPAELKKLNAQLDAAVIAVETYTKES